MLDERSNGQSPDHTEQRQSPTDEAVVTAGEHDLGSEVDDIQEQARQGWSPEQGENLLENGSKQSSVP
jgi:hypothetical protein